jgi:hypothetical protein
MFFDFGCHGRIRVGQLPAPVVDELESLPGEWLEFDASAGAVVVRHIQPTASPVLPTVAAELVRMLSVISPDLQSEVVGGDLLVHTEGKGQLVRLHVDPGGSLHIQWAHPDYAGAAKRPYTDGHEIGIEPWEQRLNGHVALSVAEPAQAAAELQSLADTFEGLYPEGDFEAVADESAGTVRVDMQDVNLDVRLLVDRLQELAQPRTLTGRVALSSFGEVAPEDLVRLIFDGGGIWLQRPLLWADASGQS